MDGFFFRFEKISVCFFVGKIVPIVCWWLQHVWFDWSFYGMFVWCFGFGGFFLVWTNISTVFFVGQNSSFKLLMVATCLIRLVFLWNVCLMFWFWWIFIPREGRETYCAVGESCNFSTIYTFQQVMYMNWFIRFHLYEIQCKIEYE